MLYAGSSWSELPISTTKQQEPNGEIFDFDFIIDQIFPNLECIDTETNFLTTVCRNPKYTLNIDQLMAKIFKIDQIMGFTLEIDENNTWDLS